ncbi:MAG TPA: hypothetical protein VMU09_01670 [Acidimicrobiales bacterium]|nr:hypothetical protein [Acidimicrobiales bacterium]
MVTEILSLSPQEPAESAGPDESQLVVTEDMTITGKNKKKRFRLR